MNEDKIFLAATGRELTRAEFKNGEWQVTTQLENIQVNCLVSDPRQAQRVYAGTQEDGVLLSEDTGKTWQPAGMGGIPVKSLALSPPNSTSTGNGKGILLAGCKPVSLYRSHDDGESWQELEGLSRARKWWWFSPAEPPDWGAYVQALTISPADPDVVMAGIELGGVLRSEDGGQSWSKHRKGAELDCHSLMFHPANGDWIYEGGGGGVAYSRDGGISWQKPKDGLGRKYGWMVAADPAQPEVWYLSASELPKMWRGEFVPLSNGEVWHTSDFGDSWVQLPFNLGGIQRTMILI